MDETEVVKLVRSAKEEIDETPNGWGRIEIVVSGKEYKFVNVVKAPREFAQEIDGGVIKLNENSQEDFNG